MLSNLIRLLDKGGLPIHLVFHITYRCNSKCKTCFLWSQLNPKINDELTTKEIDKISKNFKNILWLQIGGGEPFIRRDVPEICSSFSYVDNITIPTNCLLSVKRAMEEILIGNDTSNFIITLSLDGVGKLHDEIRGIAGNFEKFNKNYVELDKLRDRFPNLELSVNTTISNLNCSHLLEIRDYVRNNLDVKMHSFEFLRGNPKNRSVHLPDLGTCEKINNMIMSNIRFYDYGKQFSSKIIKKIKLHEQDIIFRTMSERKKQIECCAGRLSAVINPYGDVFACEDIGDKMGNLREVSYDFSRVWYSDRASIVRKKVKNCFCTHSCFNFINVIFSKRELLKTL